MDKDTVRHTLGKHFGHPISNELAIVMAAVLALPDADKSRVPDACRAFFCPGCGGPPACDCENDE